MGDNMVVIASCNDTVSSGALPVIAGLRGWHRLSNHPPRSPWKTWR